jgi:predicted permease
MNDLRLAFRQLRTRPMFAVLAAFSFSLGIGLVTTQFSLTDAILLRGLPLPDAERLMHVSRRNQQNADRGFWEPLPYRDYLQLREKQTTLQSLAAVNSFGLNLSGEGLLPSSHPGALASANLLDTLGGFVPQQGRWFTAAEDRPGQPLLVVLSHGIWKQEFSSDPKIIGRAVAINGEPGTVIGVMLPRFSFPGSAQLWTNLRPSPADPRERPVDRVEIFGKLKPGVTRDQAQAEFDTLASSLVKLWPETNQGYERCNVQSINAAYSAGSARPILLLMLAMTVFILALACVNVANMLLGRASQRTRELAVRAAVGASRGRLIRQLLGESILLATLGAAGGLLIAVYGVDAMQHYFVDEMNVPGWFDFRLDHRVLGVAVVATLAAGLLTGLVPAWQASRLDVNTALKDDSRAAAGMGLGRLSGWLVTAQIAFSTALLVGACILGWTLYAVRSVKLAHDPDRLLTGRIELHEANYPTPEHRARFYRVLMERLRGEPGIETVTVTSRNFVGSGVPTQVAPEGLTYAHDNLRPTVQLEVISREYFDLVNVRALHGRLFDSREESPAVRAAVINEAFAAKFWPKEDPLGRRFRTSQTSNDWVTVIGVVPNLRMNGLFNPPGMDEAGFYLSQDQMGWGWLDLILRTKADPLTFVPAVRKAVASLDPNQPIDSIGTLTSQMKRSIRGFTIIGSMAGIFALITLFLGAVGVYGVTSLAISRRTREFGVRLALGATVQQLLGLVLQQGARQIGIGLLLGLLAGFFLTQPLKSVFGAQVTGNPVIYVVVAVVIAAVGLLALWLPARRTSRVDPMTALRAE